MRLPLYMHNQAMLRLEPFCALHAVELAQPRQVFRCFGGLVLLQMLWREEVCFHLVQVSVSWLVDYR
jgi:hypothetical protein